MTVIQSGGDAFRDAFETYLDMVYRIALQNTRSSTDAEDLAQEVFLRLYRCGQSFRDTEHMKAWLIRVTLNLCKNYWRDHRREPVELHPVQEETTDLTLLDAVRELPPNQRNAIYLHYYEGYTAAEVGRMLGAGTNTALSWLRRGREALREKIGGIDNGDL